jgi:hypothetical protein
VLGSSVALVWHLESYHLQEEAISLMAQKVDLWQRLLNVVNGI